MKHLILSSLLSVVSVLPASAQDWALEGYDAVAYLNGRAMPGRSEIATMWQGQLWHFASEANRDRFEANPKAYVPAFDGLCPVSLLDGRKVAGDPRHFAIIGNRLYLLRSDSAEQRLWKAPRQLLKDAKQAFVTLR